MGWRGPWSCHIISLFIINSDAFEERNLAKAGYEHNPLEDNTLDGYTVITAPMTSLTKEACKDLGVKPRDAERSKNLDRSMMSTVILQLG